MRPIGPLAGDETAGSMKEKGLGQKNVAAFRAGCLPGRRHRRGRVTYSGPGPGKQLPRPQDQPPRLNEPNAFVFAAKITSERPRQFEAGRLGPVEKSRVLEQLARPAASRAQLAEVWIENVFVVHEQGLHELALDYFQRIAALSARLGCRMHPGAYQVLRQKKNIGCQAHAQGKLIVYELHQVGVVATNALDQGLLEQERNRLAQDVGKQVIFGQRGHQRRREAGGAQKRVFEPVHLVGEELPEIRARRGLNQEIPAADAGRHLVIDPGGKHQRQALGLHHIVLKQEFNPPPAALGNTVLPVAGQPQVLLVPKQANAPVRGLELPDDAQRFIRRAVVNNQNLNVGLRLRNNGSKTCSQVLSTVEYGNTYCGKFILRNNAHKLIVFSLNLCGTNTNGPLAHLFYW